MKAVLDEDCIYCGEPADTVDHLLPTYWTTGNNARDKRNLYRQHVPTVPACNECNSILGDIFEPSIVARRRLVQDKLRSKYAWVLKYKPFTDAELVEYGYALRIRLLARNSIAMRQQARLDWSGPPPAEIPDAPTDRPYHKKLILKGRPSAPLTLRDAAVMKVMSTWSAFLLRSIDISRLCEMPHNGVCSSLTKLRGRGLVSQTERVKWHPEYRGTACGWYLGSGTPPLIRFSEAVAASSSPEGS